MKRAVIITDWSLAATFMASAYTGIELHIAGHSANHEIWHNWASAHVLSNILFLLLGLYHMKVHWPWYKVLLQRGLGKKSKISLLLSVIFILVILSGLLLLTVNGANSDTGLMHYKMGLLLIVFSIIHIYKHVRHLQIFRGHFT